MQKFLRSSLVTQGKRKANTVWTYNDVSLNRRSLLAANFAPLVW